MPLRLDVILIRCTVSLHLVVTALLFVHKLWLMFTNDPQGHPQGSLGEEGSGALPILPPL